MQLEQRITIHHYDYENRWFWVLHTTEGHVQVSPCDSTSEESCRNKIEILQASGSLPQCRVTMGNPQPPKDFENRPICEAGCCPIWDTPAIFYLNRSLYDGVTVFSPRTGGKYRMVRTAKSCISRLTEREKARLTSWLVDQRVQGNECPEISTDTLKKQGEQREDLSIQERALRLLQYIEKDIKERGGKIGTYFIFTSQEMDFTPAGAWSESVDPQEVRYLLNYLCQQGLLEKNNPSNDNQYIIAPEGYTLLAQIRDDVDTEPPKQIGF